MMTIQTTNRSDKARETFLQSVRDGWSVAKAAKAAAVSRQTLYNWRKEDDAFAADWDLAVDEGTDKLEDEAYKRAFDGSDTMLIFMLKGRRPEKYAERRKVDLSAQMMSHEDALEQLE